ncbi:MAG: response regulator [Bacteroidota bacterium]
MANIILVDDHEIVMDSLKYMIETETGHCVQAKFKSGEAFLHYLEQEKPHFDLAIIDVKLPDISGLDLIKHIRKTDPVSKIILLSQYANNEFVFTGLKNGISGYLLKSSAGHELIEAIDAVLRGQEYMSREMVNLVVKTKVAEDFNIQLTNREKEILELIATGRTVRHIADVLGIEPTTVDFHKRNMKVKFNVKKSTELIRKAYELGIVNPS